MLDYRRFVSYLYSYIEGEKKTNVGYIRCEQRQGNCRFTLNLLDRQGIEGGRYKVYLYKIDANGKPIGYYLDEMEIHKCSGELRKQTNADNVWNTNHRLEDFDGVIAIYDKEHMYASQWNDEPLRTEQFLTYNEWKQKREPEISKSVYRKNQERNVINRDKLEPRKAEAEPAVESLGVAAVWEKQEPYRSEAELTPEALEGIAGSREKQNPYRTEAELSPEAIEATAGSREKQELYRTEAELSPEAIEATAGSREKQNPYRTEVELEPESVEAVAGSREKQNLYRTEAELAIESIEAVPVKREKTEQGFQHKDFGKTENIQVNEWTGAADSQEDVFWQNVKKSMESQEEPLQEAFGSSYEKVQEPFADSYSKKSSVQNTISDATLRLMKKRPKLPDFENHEIYDCVRIEPNDIGLLEMDNWKLGVNSFLSHGYYNYKYLMLGKLRFQDGVVKAVLGVPGVFDNKEQYIAKIFGFDVFVPVKHTNVKTGNFGYWIVELV